MRVLITGAAGLLGAHFAASFARDHEVTGIDRHPWWGDSGVQLLRGDLADGDFLASAFGASRPDLVIHCAAMVRVDACEDDPAAAYRANAEITGVIAEHAPPGSLVVYITTDGIFRGDRAFMTERDLPCPRTVYGRSKLHGEWEVQLSAPEHLIVRSNFFGWSSGRKLSSGEWLYQAVETASPITLFDDFYFTPIYVADLVRSVRELIDRRERGIFHVVGADRVSKYEFGMMLADVAGFATEGVKRGSLRDGQLRAPRPKDMSLSDAHFRDRTGQPPQRLRDGLERFVADRMRPLSERV